MKVAAIYTSTTPELIQMVDAYLQKHFEGEELTIMKYSDPGILKEAIESGYVTPGCARRLMDLYEKACADGAQILLISVRRSVMWLNSRNPCMK